MTSLFIIISTLFFTVYALLIFASEGGDFESPYHFAPFAIASTLEAPPSDTTTKSDLLYPYHFLFINHNRKQAD